MESKNPTSPPAWVEDFPPVRKLKVSRKIAPPTPTQAEGGGQGEATKPEEVYGDPAVAQSMLLRKLAALVELREIVCDFAPPTPSRSVPSTLQH